MADDHNEDPPNEVPAAVANIEHAEDVQRELEMREQQLQEYYRQILRGPKVEAIAPRKQPQQVAAPENEDYDQQMQEYSDRIYQETKQPQQVAAPEQQLKQGSSSGINPSYQQQSGRGRVQQFGQFLELEVAAPAQLEQGSSSGINPSYPREFAQLQEHAQEAIAAQGMPQQQQEYAVMAAQGMPQQPQQVEQGGHAPPGVPASLQNKIGWCSEPLEKQLTDSDVTRNKLWMLKKDVDSQILPLLEAQEFPVQGIQVTVYDIAGDEYPMRFKRSPPGYYYLHGEQWGFFQKRHRLKREDFLTFWAFWNAESGGLCFFIKVRR